MSKEEFLKLVYNEYNSAVVLRDKNKKRIEYFLSVDPDNKELKEAQDNLDLANKTIEKLESIILFPIFKKIDSMGQNKLMEYNETLINSLKEQIKVSKEDIVKLRKKEAELTTIQEAEIKGSSVITDEVIKRGKEIQEALTEIKVKILNAEHKVESLIREIEVLKERKSTDVQMSLYQELGLEDVEKVQEENRLRETDSLIASITDSKVIKALENKFNKYYSLQNEDISVTIKCSENVRKILDLESLENGLLKINSFNECYDLVSAVDGAKGRLSWQHKDLEREKKSEIEKICYSLEILKHTNSNMANEDFIKSIEEIILDFPKFKNQVNNLIIDLRSYSGFFAKTFQKQKIEQTKSEILTILNKYFVDLLSTFLKSLLSRIKVVDYHNSIENNSLNGIKFDEEFVQSLSTQVTIENLNEIAEEVKYQIPKIINCYSELIKELELFSNELVPIRESMRTKTKGINSELETTQKEIESIFGKRLDSYDFDELLRRFVKDGVNETLSNVHRKMIMKNVAMESSSHAISIDELKEFRNNFVMNVENPDETKGSMKV